MNHQMNHQYHCHTAEESAFKSVSGLYIQHYAFVTIVCTVHTYDYLDVSVVAFNCWPKITIGIVVIPLWLVHTAVNDLI